MSLLRGVGTSQRGARKHAATFSWYWVVVHLKRGKCDIDRPFRLRQPMEGEGTLYSFKKHRKMMETTGYGDMQGMFALLCRSSSQDLDQITRLASFRFIDPARGSDATSEQNIVSLQLMRITVQVLDRGPLFSKSLGPQARSRRQSWPGFSLLLIMISRPWIAYLIGCSCADTGNLFLPTCRTP